MLIESADSSHAPIVHYKLGGELELTEGDGLCRLRLQVKRSANLAAGGVSMCMQNTTAAVSSLASESNFGSGAIKLRAPLDELLNASRAFFHQHPRSFFVAKTIARFQRVVQVQADFVIVAQCGGDAALGVLGVRLRDFAFGEAKNPSNAGEFHRSAQTRDSSAYNDEVSFCRQLIHRDARRTASATIAVVKPMLTPLGKAESR